jgi:ElaB/YqjD/DUF883 family membrane-anchored ribosome-binding protein
MTTKDSLDVTALQGDIATLKQEFADLMSHMKRTANQAGRGAAGQLSNEAERLYRTVAEESKRHAGNVSRQVEEQPLLSVLLAFGLGIIASRVLSR